MSTKIACVLAVAVTVGPFVRPVRAEVDAEQVRSAIDRAVAYLKREQNGNGSWPPMAGYPDGVTALCTLALLNAGVPVEDPQIQKALTNLRAARPAMTYSVSLQTMVFCAAEPKKDLLLIRRNAKWLEEKQQKSGEYAGMWSYPHDGRGDNSNTQFALLALHEAERAGVPINEKTWRLSFEHWKNSQNPDGSWGYLRGMPGTGSMTSAGIASVIIASGELNAGDATVKDGKVQCCGEQQPNKIVDDAFTWLERRFSVEANPGQGAGQMWQLYYLYGVERTGRMTNRRFIGKHDWYREGADHLVRQQDRLSGYWKGSGHAEDNPLIGTSLALLFLAKGRRPVLMGKLKHGPLDDWNHHRSDLAHLTSYVETKWERELTWQIIDPAAASVEDLLQAPVLFINGSLPPEFTDEQKKNLRDYIDRGGFIFAESACGGDEFDKGFRQLITEIFPEQEYKLRRLPPEHPIWRAEEPLDPKSQYVGELWGVDVGCRTSVVYSPNKLSCYWELSRPGRGRNYPESVQEEIAAANTVGVNVLAYATNRELKYKYDTFETARAKAPSDNFERGKLYLARLQHPGGCNAAPGALTNLLQLASEKLQIRVSTDVQELGMSDPALYNYHLSFMHGRHSFRLTPAERKQLRTYLERGGMLFADAICSSKEFGEAFRREMKAILPDHELERIPVNHPMFTPHFGGEDLSTVQMRQPERAGPEGPLKAQIQRTEPYLEGIKVGDRYAVIFSRYDVSCALENHASLECEGYVRQDAARLGLNVILYSLHQ